jgi:hypothetical protein
MMRPFLYSRCATPTLSFSGLVDYVSEKGTPAINRALTLAEEIAANGVFILSRMTVMMFNLAWKHLLPYVRQSWRYHELRNSR